MPLFDLEWSARGRATIEADDADEAEKILTEGLIDLDASMFENVDVDEVSADDTKEQSDGK